MLLVPTLRVGEGFMKLDQYGYRVVVMCSYEKSSQIEWKGFSFNIKDFSLGPILDAIDVKKYTPYNAFLMRHGRMASISNSEYSDAKRIFEELKALCESLDCPLL